MIPRPPRTDSGVFEEGGLVLSKQGCVIADQRPPFQPDAPLSLSELNIPDALSLLYDQVEGLDGEEADEDELERDDGGASDTPALCRQQLSPTLRKERRAAGKLPGGGGGGAGAGTGAGAAGGGAAAGEQPHGRQQPNDPGRIAAEDLVEMGIVGSGSSGVVKKVRARACVRVHAVGGKGAAARRMGGRSSLAPLRLLGGDSMPMVTWGSFEAPPTCSRPARPQVCHGPTGEVLVLKVIQFDVNNETLRRQVGRAGRMCCACLPVTVCGRGAEGSV
jgi:hypothetical protein